MNGKQKQALPGPKEERSPDGVRLAIQSSPPHSSDMNHTAGAAVGAVGFTVVAAATVGMWFAQRWRQGRASQVEWANRIDLANSLHKGPGGGMIYS